MSRLRYWPIALMLSFFALAVYAENFAGSSKSGVPGVANIVGTGDIPDNQQAALRTAIAVADTRTLAGVLATEEFVIFGRQGFKVSARFSASGANCKIQIAYLNKFDATNKPDPSQSATSTARNKIIDYSDEITLTAGTNQYEGSYYPAPSVYFDGAGAVSLRVIVTQAPSSGTVTFWCGSK